MLSVARATDQIKPSPTTFGFLRFNGGENLPGNALRGPTGGVNIQTKEGENPKGREQGLNPDPGRTTAPPSDSLALHVVGALTGAGREAVVQRVAEGAHRVESRPVGEAGGGGGLVRLAAVLPTLPRAATTAAAGAAVVQLVQGLQGEVQRARGVSTDGGLLHADLLLQNRSIQRTKHVSLWGISMI